MVWVAIAAAAAAWLFFAGRALRAHRRNERQRGDAVALRNANQGRFNQIVWERLTATQRVTEILLCERSLGALDARVDAAARLLEGFVSPSEHLGEWRDAASSWLENVAHVIPNVADDITQPDASAMRRARASLPPRLNLSSQDLNAVIAFCIEREQFETARRRFAQQRDERLAAYAASRLAS